MYLWQLKHSRNAKRKWRASRNSETRPSAGSSARQRKSRAGHRLRAKIRSRESSTSHRGRKTIDPCSASLCKRRHFIQHHWESSGAHLSPLIGKISNRSSCVTRENGNRSNFHINSSFRGCPRGRRIDSTPSVSLSTSANFYFSNAALAEWMISTAPIP